VAAQALRVGVEPEPLVPLYLRRPDAVELADRRK
ncbi:tRNA (adenosine(37)-N6)-threonylcarbamoyltransferase complex dimerization subunit type 1 TsaB, partial [Rhodococcus hoagii]|nr:tRNA (adenosine(37)-N6)-threonylcarbamoyltransferase complex dimerization subunit type 1 TsaB [Prescottella equi]